MKQALGFTLFELIIVITITAIISATAITKFLNLSSDARVASVEMLKGKLIEGANFVHSKAVIEDVATGNDYLDIDGDGSDDISLRAGYPRVAFDCDTFIDGLSSWMSLKLDASCSTKDDSTNTPEWTGLVEKNMFHFFPRGYTSTSGNCYVTYTTASTYINKNVGWIDADSATVSATTSGCSF